ncbi:15-hydroxyprostaglandin dehydrogenase [nad(+)] [Holotrichia oblita]|uniref:15-hydroxyprostaglandin dehydrogenase [nad(+)] n=1 Tax=Holotrichia oblita TaxID=644536 RepID=A0ACB9T3V2_HOLOL|nr:15-hydroxyprostaglandin dehydrogenase [nad(+)] [Holotrichia oblita]
MFITGKVAIVTGGVSGIGFDYATELLKNGLKAVTLADTDDAKGEEAVAKISNDFGGDKVLFVKTDVTIKEQFDNAFKQTVDKFGNIDILVNNAGILMESIWEKMMAINVGCFLAMEEYFPKYKSGDEAVIVNISSIAGFEAASVVPVYVATKHAVVGFSRSISTPDQYESSRTRIVTICPGATDTPMMQEWVRKALNDRYRELTKTFVEVMTYPMQTTGAVAKALVKAIEEGGNGSMWCVEDSEIFELAVVLADTNVEKGNEAVSQLIKDFGTDKALYIQTDVTDQNQVENVFKETVNKYKNIDILINNAGVMNESIWEKEIAINLNGTIYGCLLGMEEYFPKYKSGEEGVIINVGSIGSFTCYPAVPIYAATKHAIIGLSRSLGTPDHYDSRKVRVLTICPGVTNTPLMANLGTKMVNERYLDVLALGYQNRMTVPQSPEDVARALIKVIEEGGNGSVWVVEGAQLHEIDVPKNWESIKKVNKA